MRKKITQENPLRFLLRFLLRLFYKFSLLNALNISADTLLCDLVPSASHVTDDEIRKRLEGLTPIQKKAALDLLDTYISNLPYLTNEE